MRPLQQPQRGPVPESDQGASSAPIGAGVPGNKSRWPVLRPQLVRKIDTALTVEHAHAREGVEAAAPTVHSAQAVIPPVWLVTEKLRQILAPVTITQQLANLIGAPYGLRHIPLRLHAGMYHQALPRIDGQRLAAQPVQHQRRVFCLEQGGQRIQWMQLAHPLGYRQ